MRWAAFSPKRLHVVDLDGAFDGRPANAPAIVEIVAALSDMGVPVEIGGGIRTEEDARTYVEAGAARVIIGTRAAEDPGFVKALEDSAPCPSATQFAELVAEGIDRLRKAFAN